jgi:tyrosine aminotransferase
MYTHAHKHTLTLIHTYVHTLSFLQPERGWEVDLEDLASKIDNNTAALFLNNPSNPCGCVYSRKHLEDILALCERYKLPIISDEIYDGMVRLIH